ncbi:MAG: ATP-binding cassette domain-containing protein [Desulforegulaceae bacterium]|nr:ATP-binding cassette domain-containing protein [Desulforegulaceae bacterium]
MKIKINNLFFKYKNINILKDISLEIKKNKITAISGVSGAGKSTLLFCLNRLYEEFENTKVKGSIHSFLDNKWIDIFDKSVSLPWLRQKTGLVFQNPNPFPMSIEKNLYFPFRLLTAPKIKSKNLKTEIITTLKKVHLYEEVKSRLKMPASSLSGGQQQRLSIARALIAKPEIIMLDEPTSSLDPESEKKIETLLKELKKECTIIMVSHSMEQIKRISDHHIKIENKTAYQLY